VGGKILHERLGQKVEESEVGGRSQDMNKNEEKKREKNKHLKSYKKSKIKNRKITMVEICPASGYNGGPPVHRLEPAG
jgi:hypothetical protein